MLVSDIVRRNAHFDGHRDAIVVPDGRTTSWGQLDERTSQLARAFLSLGLGQGDRLAYIAPNCGEYVEFFFASAKAGVIGAATNIRLGAGELASYLRHVEPRAAVVHAGVEELARDVLAGVPSVEHVVGLGPDHGFDLDYETLLGAQPATEPAVRVHDTDAYQLAPTSGTTGVPKGAVLTHRNAIAAMLNWLAEIPTPPHSTTHQNIPFFFNPGGPAGLHPVLMKGGRTVVRPSFDAGVFLRSVAEYSVTHVILVPTMLRMVFDHPECGGHDVSSIMAVTCGGSPVTRDLLRRGHAVFGDVFYPTYGLAETYSCGLVLRPHDQHTEGTDEQVRRLGSAGKPQVLMQVRVVGAGGEDVPRDNATAGEVWLSGDTVSPEYFRMREETAASRSEGWFRSGDLGVMDEEGFVTIVDRLKDVIITGGINVFSGEVEEAVRAHPAVADAAVIGIPHATWGEAIHAVVILRDGAAASEAEIVEFAGGRLAGYKKPRSVSFSDALPVNATGKVLKRVLRQPFWAGRERLI